MKTHVCIVTFILLMCISCNKENDISPLSSATQSSDLTTQSAGGHFIGQQFGGGIIFYIDKSGQHGLIAAPEDIVEPAFWSLKDTINGAKAVALGTGSANTTKNL